MHFYFFFNSFSLHVLSTKGASERALLLCFFEHGGEMYCVFTVGVFFRYSIATFTQVKDVGGVSHFKGIIF